MLMKTPASIILKITVQQGIANIIVNIITFNYYWLIVNFIILNIIVTNFVTIYRLIYCNTHYIISNWLNFVKKTISYLNGKIYS